MMPPVTSVAAVAALMVIAAATASAQVGYPPAQSPFRDLRERQEVTFFTGWYLAKKDPARVAPQSGPLVGAHYQWRASGPANITFDFARVETERRVLDPERDESSCAADSLECKYLGTMRWPMYMADLGLALALTGSRSFLRLVPEVRAGLGLASDFHTQPDVGNFAFGTRFAFTWGAGIRWVPGNRFQLRADVINHLYSVRYPDQYYMPAGDGTSIFPADQSRSAWLNNPAFTIGLSYLFAR
jgi:hypothetical protein